MRSWDTSVPDWQERILDGRSLIPHCPWYDEEAAAALRVFKRLKLVDVPGHPTMGEACPQWVFDFVYAVFGAFDAETKKRVIQHYFLMVAKKNAKSSLAAGIMLTALIRNRRDAGEYVILAPTKEIADNSFIPAFGMVNADPALKKLFNPNKNYRLIENIETGATLRVKAADQDVVGGQKAIGTLIDELWLFGKKPLFENVLSEATGALAARPEGFMVYLTTQSDEPPAGVFAKKLTHHRRVRDGVTKDGRSLSLIYEFPPHIVEDDDWQEHEALWSIPNPNMGRSVDIDFLRSQMEINRGDGKEAFNLFIAKHFNVEIGLRLRSDRWIGADYWEANVDKALTLDVIFARSDVVAIGVDGGGLSDLLGAAVIGRDKVTGQRLLWNHAWAHKIVLDRHRTEATVLRGFAEDGDLTIVENPLRGFDEVAAIAARAEALELLPEKHAIAMDSFGVDQIVQAMARVGIERERIEGVSQGWQLNGPIQSLGVLLASGGITHGGTRLMSYCVSNAKIEPKGNAVSITKQSSGRAKIDPLLATFAANKLMALNPERVASVFDQLGEDDSDASDQAPSEADDAAILRDPSHPQWQEARQRYEEAFASADDEF